jgi:sugar phosphate permease
MIWFFINVFGFIGTPAGLIWAWYTYAVSKDRRKLTLAALMMLTCSLLLLTSHLLSVGSISGVWINRIGVLIPVLALALVLRSGLRQALSVALASVGIVMLWFGLTIH